MESSQLHVARNKNNIAARVIHLVNGSDDDDFEGEVDEVEEGSNDILVFALVILQKNGGWR